jgi:hypothetical protein
VYSFVWEVLVNFSCSVIAKTGEGWGLIAVSVVLLFASGLSGEMPAAEFFPAFHEFRKLKGIYEPSGVRQFAEGRLTVVQDDPEHAPELLTLHADGNLSG